MHGDRHQQPPAQQPDTTLQKPSPRHDHTKSSFPDTEEHPPSQRSAEEGDAQGAQGDAQPAQHDTGGTPDGTDCTKDEAAEGLLSRLGLATSSRRGKQTGWEQAEPAVQKNAPSKNHTQAPAESSRATPSQKVSHHTTAMHSGETSGPLPALPTSWTNNNNIYNKLEAGEPTAAAGASTAASQEPGTSSASIDTDGAKPKGMPRFWSRPPRVRHGAHQVGDASHKPADATSNGKSRASSKGRQAGLQLQVPAIYEDEQTLGKDSAEADQLGCELQQSDSRDKSLAVGQQTGKGGLRPQPRSRAMPAKQLAAPGRAQSAVAGIDVVAAGRQLGSIRSDSFRQPDLSLGNRIKSVLWKGVGLRLVSQHGKAQKSGAKRKLGSSKGPYSANQTKPTEVLGHSPQQAAQGRSPAGWEEVVQIQVKSRGSPPPCNSLKGISRNSSAPQSYEAILPATSPAPINAAQLHASEPLPEATNGKLALTPYQSLHINSFPLSHSLGDPSYSQNGSIPSLHSTPISTQRSPLDKGLPSSYVVNDMDPLEPPALLSHGISPGTRSVSFSGDGAESNAADRELAQQAVVCSPDDGGAPSQAAAATVGGGDGGGMGGEQADKSAGEIHPEGGAGRDDSKGYWLMSPDSLDTIQQQLQDHLRYGLESINNTQQYATTLLFGPRREEEGGLPTPRTTARSQAAAGAERAVAFVEFGLRQAFNAASLQLHYIAESVRHNAPPLAEADDVLGQCRRQIDLTADATRDAAAVIRGVTRMGSGSVENTSASVKEALASVRELLKEKAKGKKGKKGESSSRWMG